jgi:hypothetical protein
MTYSKGNQLGCKAIFTDKGVREIHLQEDE